MLEHNSNKINYLEGVRGIAAFIVVLHHFGLAFYPAHYLLKNGLNTEGGVLKFFYIHSAFG